MKGAAVKAVLLGVVVAVMAMGCVTATPSLSSYSTQQLRQELAMQKAIFSNSHQTIDEAKRDYKDSVNNQPTLGMAYGAGAIGSIDVLNSALEARIASKKIDAIQLELIRRGEWSPDDIK